MNEIVVRKRGSEKAVFLYGVQDRSDKPQDRYFWKPGAGSGDRTRTWLPIQEFESCASTNSAIPASATKIAFLNRIVNQYLNEEFDCTYNKTNNEP